MGYEIKLIIGSPTSCPGPEFQRDLSKPYEDGSGYEYAKDSDGNLIKTGRTEVWFEVFGMLDLCKLGYQEDALNSLIGETSQTAKSNGKTVHFFYAEDGNTRIDRDRYDDPMWPVPASKVLAAINELGSEALEYRRLRWAKALLESVATDEEAQVMFYGH